MKKVLMMMALCCAAFVQAKAETVGDTLVIEDVNKVKIETRGDLQRIVISGAKDDPQFHYVQRISYTDTSAVDRTVTSVKDFTKRTVLKKKDKKGTVETSLHALLGLTTMLEAPSDYSFKLWPSFEFSVGINLDWYPFGKHNYWSTGLAIDWRKYRTQKDMFWAKNAAGSMELTPYDALQSPTRTTLSAFSLQVPLLYTHNFDNKGEWSVTLGGIVNFNTGAHATRLFDYNDESYEVETKSIGQRPVTIDGFLKIGTPCFFDLYVKYCPNEFFKDGRGPKMRQLSFGLYF
jgi:hypothetical protein